MSQLKPFLTPIVEPSGRRRRGLKLQVCTQVNGSYVGYKKLSLFHSTFHTLQIKLILRSVMFMVYLFGQRPVGPNGQKLLQFCDMFYACAPKSRQRHITGRLGAGECCRMSSCGADLMTLISGRCSCDTNALRQTRRAPSSIPQGLRNPATPGPTHHTEHFKNHRNVAGICLQQLQSDSHNCFDAACAPCAAQPLMLPTHPLPPPLIGN